MRLLDALSPSATVSIPDGYPVNILAVLCDCGVRFAWQSRYSLVQCPNCGARALWHGDNAVWSAVDAVMENAVVR